MAEGQWGDYEKICMDYMNEYPELSTQLANRTNYLSFKSKL